MEQRGPSSSKKRYISSQTKPTVVVVPHYYSSYPSTRRTQAVPKAKRIRKQNNEVIVDEDSSPAKKHLYRLVSNINQYSKPERIQISPPPSYGVVYNPTSVVNPLISPDGLGVRFPSYHSLAGTYDIVFYFAQWNGDYIHHRTTKGTLTLSASNEESIYCKERRRFIRRTVPRGGETIQGTVQMDDIVKQGDRFSMGRYNFAFLQNNLRYRIVIDPTFQIDLSQEQIRKANAEIDIHVKGCQKQPIRKSPFGNNNVSMHRGRIKLVAQRAPLQIRKNQTKECACIRRDSNNIEQETVQFKSVDEAEKTLEYYTDVDNSWLSKYINLPKDVLSVIHQFICPPPVFFFEKGDLWVEVDWNFRKGDLNSIFVARKRV